MKHSTETPVLLNFVNLIYNILSKIVEGHTWATRKTRNYSFICGHLQCVKSVRIWIFSGPYFPPFRLNADQKNSEYGHFSRSVDLLNVISIQKKKKKSAFYWFSLGFGSLIVFLMKFFYGPVTDLGLYCSCFLGSFANSALERLFYRAPANSSFCFIDFPYFFDLKP